MRKVHLGSMLAALAAALVFAVIAGPERAAAQTADQDRKVLEALYNATRRGELVEQRELAQRRAHRRMARRLHWRRWTRHSPSPVGEQPHGTIPPELGGLDALTRLDLYSNSLSGRIPAELGKLTSLEALNISGNDLSGPIPSALGKLTNLKELHLANNGLSGEIPAQLGSLTRLRDIYLSGNDLSGCIPQGLEDMRVVGYNDLGSLDLETCGETEAASAPADTPTPETEPATGACGAPSGASVPLDIGWLALGLTLPGLALPRRRWRN